MSKIILVTGATAGFGNAMTRRFVADGHRVIATGRRWARLNDLRHELGEAVLPFELDVTDAAAVAAVPSALPENWRDIDVLVNNAGLALGISPAQASDLAQWDQMVATNVSGLIHVTHALLPGMVDRDRGHIINLGSTAGAYPYPGGNVYGASKAFVAHFTANLKADLVGTNVKVTSLEPGLVGGTEFSEIRLGGDLTKAQSVYANTTPLRPEDIAETVSWIIGLPAHVNINRIELMPTCQAPGPLIIKRRE